MTRIGALKQARRILARGDEAFRQRFKVVAVKVNDRCVISMERRILRGPRVVVGAWGGADWADAVKAIRV